MLSQEEINALLQGGIDESDSSDDELNLTDKEKDALGEVGNISMGTAATTLFTLLNQRVSITTPRISIASLSEIYETFEDPCVSIHVGYTVGLDGNNLMILNAKDVKVITDLMLGGDGTNIGDELNEMHLSAISEAMNQMIGSSSTSLSEMIGEKVDISPPQAYYKGLADLSESALGFKFDEKAVMIAFRMTVGDIVDSEIMQFMPITMAKSLIKAIMPSFDEGTSSAEPVVSNSEPSQVSAETKSVNEAATQPVQAVQMPNQQSISLEQKPPQPANVQSVEFPNFGSGVQGTFNSADISLIRNVPLEISVELGRTSKKISEILDFASGSVIELDKVVGDSLSILANGRPIAKGEVVVVDENYGIRITEIVIPENRV